MSQWVLGVGSVKHISHEMIPKLAPFGLISSLRRMGMPRLPSGPSRREPRFCLAAPSLVAEPTKKGLHRRKVPPNRWRTHCLVQRLLLPENPPIHVFLGKNRDPKWFNSSNPSGLLESHPQPLAFVWLLSYPRSFDRRKGRGKASFQFHKGYTQTSC